MGGGGGGRVTPVTLPHRGMWSTWGRHGGPGAYGAASAVSGSGASLGRSMHGSLEWLSPEGRGAGRDEERRPEAASQGGLPGAAGLTAAPQHLHKSQRRARLQGRERETRW